MLNLVDEQKRLKEKHGLEVLEWVIYDRIDVAIKKGDQIGTGNAQFFDQAVQMAIDNLGKGDEKLYDLIVKHDLIAKLKGRKEEPELVKTKKEIIPVPKTIPVPDQPTSCRVFGAEISKPPEVIRGYVMVALALAVVYITWALTQIMFFRR